MTADKSLEALIAGWRAKADNTEEHRIGLSWAHGSRITYRACADVLATWRQEQKTEPTWNERITLRDTIHALLDDREDAATLAATVECDNPECPNRLMADRIETRVQLWMPAVRRPQQEEAKHGVADPNDGASGEAAYCHHRHHLDAHTTNFDTCPHSICVNARHLAVRRPQQEEHGDGCPFYPDGKHWFGHQEVTGWLRCNCGARQDNPVRRAPLQEEK